jgi:hypothetical protein
MKKVCTVLCLALCTPLFADGPSFSGILDSKFNFISTENEAASFGIEEYANLRIQSKIRDRAVFYGAFNLIAASGISALPLISPAGAIMLGENYAATLELERLYFRINSDTVDADIGLMRMAFGYGQVFGPMDFLNPKNPLTPDARPRAVLGGALHVYPGGTAKFSLFEAAPKEPLTGNGEGFRIGLSGENHWDKASIQGLYVFKTPGGDYNAGIHRAGLSIKADIALGLTADILYTYDYNRGFDIDGLSASAGFDYSFFDGRFYLLAEYLYNGAKSVTSQSDMNSDPPRGYKNRQYLYTTLLYRWNDYTNTGLGLFFDIENLSFIPIVTAEHDIFQGLTLNLTVQTPINSEEAYCTVTASAKLRF